MTKKTDKPRHGRIECRYHELVAISDLKPHPKNPNEHSPEQLAYYEKIMKGNRVREPVRVSKLSGFVTKGHGQILAARKAGWTHVPVEFQDYETPDHEYADLVADNELAKQATLDMAMVNLEIAELGPDLDIDLLGIAGFKVEPADKDAPDPDDDTPEPPATPRSKRGEVWILGRHRLMCGDSLDLADVGRLIGQDRPQLVFTDPPYGIAVVNKQGTIGTGQLAKATVYRPVIGDETIDAAVKSYEICRDLEIPTMIIWGANYFASALPDGKKWLVWDKQRPEGMTFSDCELAWTNLEGGVKKYSFLWNGMIREGEREKRVHPTQKPVGLIGKIFADFPGEIVLDLFGGSGATLIACERAERRCLMMEIDPRYVDVIIERWETMTGEKAEKEKAARGHRAAKKKRRVRKA